MKNSANDPIYIAEDHILRSNHIQELVQNPFEIEGFPCTTTIPKVIIQYWHDMDEIPVDVQDCIHSWEPLIKQGFKRILFDDAYASHFILNEFGNSYLNAFKLCHHPAMRCDYLRLCYVLKYGGFYVDADEYYQETDFSHYFFDNRLKIQPLCYDKSNDEMVDINVFMVKCEYSPDWIFYVNNNPLIAPPYHPVIRLALNRATRILLYGEVKQPEIQSTTGPGNLSASLVKHSLRSKLNGNPPDFKILSDWETISISKWPLSYRYDERNWRFWDT